MAVASEEYRPWFVLCHRVPSSEAFRVVKALDVAGYTIKAAPPSCGEFSVLLKGFTRERAILVPSEEVRASKKAAWFLSGWAEQC